MTHTLHRRGDRDSLSRDFVFLIMPSKDVNHVGSAPKLRRFLEIARECGCVKFGDCRSGNEYYQGGKEKVVQNVQDRAVVHAVFDDRAKVVTMMKRLVQAELGLSVVVSGLMDVVDGGCHEAGIQRHTVEHSGGIWGRTDRLPQEGILQINTMCGHGMVTVNLIKDVIERIKAGKLTVEQGAEELFKPCMCGIFNPKRAEELLQNLVEAS